MQDSGGTTRPKLPLQLLAVDSIFFGPHSELPGPKIVS